MGSWAPPGAVSMGNVVVGAVLPDAPRPNSVTLPAPTLPTYTCGDGALAACAGAASEARPIGPRSAPKTTAINARHAANLCLCRSGRCSDADWWRGEWTMGAL